MSGFTISASEYQAMIARRDIRIAELMDRLSKYEQPDDAEPVTEDHTKLAELGFANVGDDAYGLWEHPQYGVVIVFGLTRTVMRVCHGGTRLFAPSWFQVRRLVAALKGEP